ncbi:hypothetical protein LCGC14_1112710 [marine sediment metagenome]|uniref:UDP-3-O-[3-hydroxymyristoyl] glucosamine N-acyltransferase non-repeat region domain-containing protein n=1 Tax=marine sediment metagenome TaxID=412755 RepID=A0A0F9MU70_9ZZZZ
MPDVCELRAFLADNGAEIVHCGEDCDQIKITHFAHYEDAKFGNISWLRHKPVEDFAGTVLLIDKFDELNELPDHCGYQQTLESWQLVIAHAGIRELVAKTIRCFFRKDCYPVKIATTPRIHPAAIVGPARFSPGVDAQNYTWEPDGWTPFPSTGGIRVEEDVEVGAYATIVRGSVGDTVIGKGCRIGQHVNIGHDCRIGAHTLIIAGASLAGWVRVGKHCKIYQGAIIKNGVSIGDGAVIGQGSNVLDDVPAGQIWVGNPAKKKKIRRDS